MEQLNRIQLRGIVGSIRVSDISGKKFARITLATNYAYRSQDGCAIIETTWSNVVAWESPDIQDLSQIQKGDWVEITGRLRNQRYTTPEGEDRYTTKNLTQNLRVLDNSKSFTFETQ